jgi:hypothetical protein
MLPIALPIFSLRRLTDVIYGIDPPPSAVPIGSREVRERLNAAEKTLNSSAMTVSNGSIVLKNSRR